MGAEALGSLARALPLCYPHRQLSRPGRAGTQVKGRSARASGWKEYGGGCDGQSRGKSPAPPGILGSEGEKRGSLWASPATATHWPGKGSSKRSPLSPQMKKPGMRDDEFSGSAPRAPSSPPVGWAAVEGVVVTVLAALCLPGKVIWSLYLSAGTCSTAPFSRHLYSVLRQGPATDSHVYLEI